MISQRERKRYCFRHQKINTYYLQDYEGLNKGFAHLVALVIFMGIGPRGICFTLGSTFGSTFSFAFVLFTSEVFGTLCLHRYMLEPDTHVKSTDELRPDLRDQSQAMCTCRCCWTCHKTVSEFLRLKPTFNTKVLSVGGCI